MAKKEHKIILGLDARQFRKGIDNVSNDMRMLKGVFAAVMGAAAIKQVQAMVMEFADLGVKVQNVTTAFNKLDNSAAVLKELRGSTQGMVSDLNLMQQANTFKAMGLPVEKLGKFLAFANQRAAETGQSVDYLVDSLVQGLSKESLLRLDNLALNMSDFKEELKATGDYAEALSNTIDKLGGSSIEASPTKQLLTDIENLRNEISVNTLPATHAWLSWQAKQIKIIKRELTLYYNIARELTDFLRLTEKRFSGGASGSWAPDPEPLKEAAETVKSLSEKLKSLKANQTLSATNAEWMEWSRLITEVQEKINKIKFGARPQESLITGLATKGLPQVYNGEGGLSGALQPMEDMDTTQQTVQFTELAQSIAGVGSALVNAAFSGENFGEAMINMLKQLAIQLMATAAAAALLAAFTPQLSFAGALGGQGAAAGFGGAMRVSGADLLLSIFRSGNSNSRTGGN